MRAVLLAVALIVLSGCASNPNSLDPRGVSSDQALEAYRIYRAHCSSQFGWPFFASVSCDKTPVAETVAPPDPALIRQIIREEIARARLLDE